MDISGLNFTGKINEYNGLIFTIKGQGNRYVLDFLVKKLKSKRSASLNITMHPDPNHHKPHIHITKGKQRHIASIDLNGKLMAGGQDLSKTDIAIISEWLMHHNNSLLELWNSIKYGRNYTVQLSNVQKTWEYDNVIFRGEKPEKKTVIDGVIVWYNGTMSYSAAEGGNVRIVCSKEVCAYFPKGLESKHDTFIFECKEYQCKSEAKNIKG